MSDTATKTGRVITENTLRALESPCGGYTRDTLEALGVPWPPPEGWKRSLLGKPLPDAAARLLFSLKEQTRKEDDGVIWEKVYTVREVDGGYFCVDGPGVALMGDGRLITCFRDQAEEQAHRLNVAHNAGRNAARRTQ